MKLVCLNILHRSAPHGPGNVAKGAGCRISDMNRRMSVSEWCQCKTKEMDTGDMSNERDRIELNIRAAKM